MPLLPLYSWTKRVYLCIVGIPVQTIVNCRNKATISYPHNMCTGRRVRVACSVELHHMGMEMSRCVKTICSLLAKWLTHLRWYTGTFAFHQGTHRGQLSFGNRWTIIHWLAVWRLQEFFVVGHCVISRQAWLGKFVYNRTWLSLLAFSLPSKDLLCR